MNERNITNGYNDFANRVYNSNYMNRFNESIEADIFDKISTTENGIDMPRIRGIFGNDHKPAPVVISGTGVDVKGDAKATYQTALFYYSLYTECKTYRRPSGNHLWIPEQTDICLVNQSGVQSRARWVSAKSSLTQSTFIFKNTCNNGYHHDWRPYSASRGLKSYTLDGNFKFWSSFAGQWGNHYAGIYKF